MALGDMIDITLDIRLRDGTLEHACRPWYSIYMYIYIYMYMLSSSAATVILTSRSSMEGDLRCQVSNTLSVSSHRQHVACVVAVG